MKDYYSIHDGHNVSGHSAVSLELTMSVSYLPTAERKFYPKPKWTNATECNLISYADMLDSLLSEVDVPWHALSCTDINCQAICQHCNDIQLFHDQIIDCCISAGKRNIPYTSAKPVTKMHKNVAGWNDRVKPFRDASIFWHSIWKSCNSPRNGVVADIMRQSRAKYHRIVRQVTRSQEAIRRDKMAESLLSDNTRHFWNEVRKVNGKCSTLPNMIDGAQGDADVSDVFVSKYEALYNSVSYVQSDMDKLMDEINVTIKQSDNENVLKTVVINSTDIVEAISHVKNGKKDGYGLIYTDHFKHGPKKLNLFLSFLFNSMIVHGYAPDGFNVSSIVPLVKNKRKSLNNSSNYRAIALSSPLSKILDWVIIKKNINNLQFSDLQYGFKAKSSTTQCTFTLFETMNYYHQHDSNTYVLCLTGF